MGGNEEAGRVLAYIRTKARVVGGVDPTARAKSCCIQCAKACTVIFMTTLFLCVCMYVSVSVCLYVYVCVCFEIVRNRICVFLSFISY